ncbi:MAG: MerR family DNA-binding protein [Gemmatimonadota bacterium]|jgi:MerR family mercuric resistance operon transcriptional regulator|nr:MerR family DNA-binding protein [Gemmatimonadota bacterium]
MQQLKIGQVAEEAGVGVETVRFYQRSGLIPEPPRRGTEHRRYPSDAVARIRFIRGAQNVGFSLKEIEELMALQITPGTTKGDIRTRAEAKVANIEEKIRDLQRMRDTLVKLIGACEGMGSLDDCPILEAFDRGPGANARSEAKEDS